MDEFTGFAASPIRTLPSPQSARLLKRGAFVRRMQEGARTSGLSLWGNRVTMNAFTPLARAPRGGSAKWVRYEDGVRARLATTRDADPAGGVLMWIHGGALVAGHPKLEQQAAADYAGCVPAFLPRYRFAPEHPFPAAADDVLAAYRCLLGQGFPADKIRLGGMSAGGLLTVGLLGDITRAGLPMPAAVLLVSPVLQMSAELAHARDAEQSDPSTSPDFIERTNKAYAGKTPLTAPRLDHLAADMSSWPPTLIQVGGTECLVAEAELLRTRLQAAGVRCELQIWPGQVHGFPALGGSKVPEAITAREYGRRFLAAEPDAG